MAEFKLVIVPNHAMVKGQIVSYRSPGIRKGRHAHVISVGDHGDLVLLDHWSGAVRVIRDNPSVVTISEARPCCRKYIKEGKCHE
jgi:hypothetical protein